MAWECTVGVLCSGCGLKGHLLRTCPNVFCHRYAPVLQIPCSWWLVTVALRPRSSSQKLEDRFLPSLRLLLVSTSSIRSWLA